MNIRWKNWEKRRRSTIFSLRLDDDRRAAAQDFAGTAVALVSLLTEILPSLPSMSSSYFRVKASQPVAARAVFGTHAPSALSAIAGNQAEGNERLPGVPRLGAPARGSVDASCRSGSVRKRLQAVAAVAGTVSRCAAQKGVATMGQL